MTSTRTRNFDASIFWYAFDAINTKAMEDKHRELYSAIMLKKQGVISSSLLAACGRDLR
ncbi:BnaC03g77250D [Brassica napus]|uniref:BnaC03g77250D protein n=2 Tax=Brassica napus TaxID=3708 RepID=A0A078JN13_BRANA|nr:BnaC03g77250D [Brassica napus]